MNCSSLSIPIARSFPLKIKKLIQVQQLLMKERQEPQHSRNKEISSIEKAIMKKEPSLKEISNIGKDIGGLKKQSQKKTQSRSENSEVESWVDNKCCSTIISSGGWILLMVIGLLLFFRGSFWGPFWIHIIVQIITPQLNIPNCGSARTITEAPLKFQPFSWEARNILQTESAKINVTLLAYFFPLIYISPSTSDHLLTCFSSFHFFSFPRKLSSPVWTHICSLVYWSRHILHLLIDSYACAPDGFSLLLIQSQKSMCSKEFKTSMQMFARWTDTS